MTLGRRERPPEMERPYQGERSRDAQERRRRNREARDAWEARWSARCAQCGHVRFHVSHEMDPETSPEGPAYHAEFEHHPFVEPG